MNGRGSEPRHPAAWSAGALVFAAVVASVIFMNIHGGLLFCTSERSHGANVDRGLAIVFWTGIGALVIPFVRKHRRALALVLVVAAAALGAAMVFVALDSATYIATDSCGLFDVTETTVNERLYYLYFLWGAPFGVLCWFARELWASRNASTRPATRGTSASLPSVSGN